MNLHPSLHSLAPLLPAGATLLAREDGRAVGEAITRAIPWLEPLAIVALLDENTSNYPCMATASPLAGYVIHIAHDDAPLVLARTLEAFVDLAREVWATGDVLGACHALGEDRSASDERAAAWLLSSCRGDDTGRQCAVQLTGDAWPDLLLPILADPDPDSMWAREAAAARLGVLGDKRAVPALQALFDRGRDAQDAREARRAISMIRRRHPGPL